MESYGELFLRIYTLQPQSIPQPSRIFQNHVFCWGEANKKRFLFSASFGRWVSGRNKTCRIDKKVWTACPQVIPLVITSGENNHAVGLGIFETCGKNPRTPNQTHKEKHEFFLNQHENGWFPSTKKMQQIIDIPGIPMKRIIV